MKPKKLRKKIQQLETRLREGQTKLAKLKQKLNEAERAKALKAARKSAVRVSALHPVPKLFSANAKKTPKIKRNISPERRAQLSAAMKARWVAKRAASDGHATPDSGAQDSTQQPPSPPPLEGGSDGA
jgi:hypothetical protein